MSDDDYAIETADAGASATIPMEAGQVKKGGYVSFPVFEMCHSTPLTSIVPCAGMSLWNYQ